MEIFNKNGKLEKIDILTLRKEVNPKTFYVHRLMEVLGRGFWGVKGVTKDWTEDMLSDGLKHCEPFSNIKLRNIKFNEYLADTKK